MKLSELIFETQILLEEETFVVRKTPDGRRWGVYNTTSGTSVFISGHKSKGQAERAAEKLRNPTPPPKKKKAPKPKSSQSKKPKTSTTSTKTPVAGKLSKGLSQIGESKWLLYIADDSVVTITNQSDATKLSNYLDSLDGKTPEQITKAFSKTELMKLGLQKIPEVTSNPIKRAIKELSHQEFVQKVQRQNSSISKWIAEHPKTFGVLKSLGNIIGVVGTGLSLFYGTMLAISEIEEEMQQPGANQKELRLEADILRGQLIIMLVAILMPYLRISAKARAIIALFGSMIKTGIAIIGGAVAIGTLGTAAPAAAAGVRLGWLITTGAELLIWMLLSQPSVQRYIAQLIAGSILKDLVAGVGNAAEQYLLAMNEWLDGQYGTKFLADSLTTEQEMVGGVTGEYYSDSEWAKLVFGTLLFPEGTPTKLVPYIDTDRREKLLSEQLGIESVNSTPQLSPRLDTKGETPQPQSTANLSSRLDTKGETPQSNTV